FTLATLLLVAFLAIRLFGGLRLGAPLRPRRGVRRVGGFQVSLIGARRDPGLDGLDLGDVTGDWYLGVVLRPRLSAALGAGAFVLLSFASAAFGLALCAGFR